jgi:hypothetical protein
MLVKDGMRNGNRVAAGPLELEETIAYHAPQAATAVGSPKNLSFRIGPLIKGIIN